LRARGRVRQHPAQQAAQPDGRREEVLSRA
jgi:hypothetical protein